MMTTIHNLTRVTKAMVHDLLSVIVFDNLSQSRHVNFARNIFTIVFGADNTK